MPSGACAAFVRAHAKPPQLRLQEKPRTSLRSGRNLPLLPGPVQVALSLKWDLFVAFAPSGLGGGPRPGARMALMAFNRRAGAGRLPASTGLIELAISKSALARYVPSSVTSEPLFGAEPRPQSRPSMVLRFKSARSNRKASKRAEPSNHAKRERSQSPRGCVAAVRRAAGGLRPPGHRHAASAFKEKRLPRVAAVRRAAGGL